MPSEPTAVEVFEQMVAAYNAHDLDAVYAAMAPGYRQFVNGTLHATGPVETRAADSVLYDLVPDYRREVLDLFGDGDRAVCRSRISGTTADGAAFALEVATVIRVEHGELAEGNLYFDIVTAFAPRP